MFTSLKRLFNSKQPSIMNMVANDRIAIHTPDILQLEQKANHLVFLYDYHQTNHPQAVKAEHLWNGYTNGRFLMWRHNKRPFIIHPTREFQRLPCLPIRGEVVRILTPGLISLDSEYKNRVEFKRVRAKINVPHHQLTYTKDRSTMERIHGIPHIKGDLYPLPCTSQIEAWMYVGISKFWSPKIDGGYEFSPAKIITPNRSNPYDNTDKYYFFPPNSYVA